jgi:hypothetical protein
MSQPLDKEFDKLQPLFQQLKITYNRGKQVNNPNVLIFGDYPDFPEPGVTPTAVQDFSPVLMDISPTPEDIERIEPDEFEDASFEMDEVAPMDTTDINVSNTRVTEITEYLQKRENERQRYLQSDVNVIISNRDLANDAEERMKPFIPSHLVPSLTPHNLLLIPENYKELVRNL